MKRRSEDKKWSGKTAQTSINLINTEWDRATKGLWNVEGWLKREWLSVISFQGGCGKECRVDWFTTFSFLGTRTHPLSHRTIRQWHRMETMAQFMAKVLRTCKTHFKMGKFSSVYHHYCQERSWGGDAYFSTIGDGAKICHWQFLDQLLWTRLPRKRKQYFLCDVVALLQSAYIFT